MLTEWATARQLVILVFLGTYPPYSGEATSKGVSTVKNIKKPLQLFGSLATVMGIIWIGQGTGVFPYPEQSFMISQMPWAYRGAALAVVGVGMLYTARRLQ